MQHTTKPLEEHKESILTETRPYHQASTTLSIYQTHKCII